MRTLIRVFPAIMVACFASFPGHAATQFTATVTNVSMYGNGAVTIYISSPISEPGCSPNATRIDIQGSDPNIKQILAIALSALASGMKVFGQVNGCDPDSGTPTLDQTYNSWTSMYPAS